MNRGELERLTKPELIDLLLGLQRPDKTSRTSSNPPSTDRKGKRVGSRPGGAKPGHKGHARALAETADAHEDHRPAHCQHCGLPFVEDAMGEVVGEYDEIDLPEVKPIIRRHRRMSCRCATCGKATSAPMPQAAQGTPFGRRILNLFLETLAAICIPSRWCRMLQRSRRCRKVSGGGLKSYDTVGAMLADLDGDG